MLTENLMDSKMEIKDRKCLLVFLLNHTEKQYEFLCRESVSSKTWGERWNK